MPTATAEKAAFIRRLVALSFDETGAVSQERVQAILDTLAVTRIVAVLRPLLKTWHNALRRELAKREVCVEHAGTLDPQTLTLITEHFSRLHHRPLSQRTRKNPELLAGLRVRVGDNVYDASVRGTLDRLAAAFA